MKRFVLALVSIVLISTTMNAAGPVKFGVQANMPVLTMPDLSTVYGVGYGFGAHLDISLVVVSIRIMGDYTVAPMDEDKYKSYLESVGVGTASSITIDGGDITGFSASANVKFAFPIPVVSPYLTAGFGFRGLKQSDFSVKVNDQVVTSVGSFDETKSAFNAGAGVDLDVLAFALYLEGRYELVFTEGESPTLFTATLGITF